MADFLPSIHSSTLEITGSKSDLLKDKKILIGMSGSVAVNEMVKTARLLMRHGAKVYAVMTPAAMELIHSNLVEWATGNPVITKLTGQIEHVHLGGEHPDCVDLVLVAPSTANTIGKIANGIDDTPVTTIVTTAVGTGVPVAIVPAMHGTMYQNPMVIKNIEYLKFYGFTFIGPRVEEGKAKIATANEILEAVIGILTPKNLLGKKIVITAGPTRVWLDNVRYITNPSSGKMGIQLANEAANRGADVTLILGPTSESVYNMAVKVVNIETPEDIVNVIDGFSEVDIFISAAAISDYQPKEVVGKIPSGQDNYTIKMEPTSKIIPYFRKKFPTAKIIGFKAESGITKNELVHKAIKRFDEYSLEMVVGNLVCKTERGFGTEKNEVLLIKGENQVEEVPLQSKRKIAKKILDELI